MSGIITEALGDIGRALRLRRVWMALAIEDIGDAHRRTTLGPAWILVNYLVFVGTFIVIFGPHMGGGNYPAYIAVGFLVWGYVSETIALGVTLFLREENFIKGTVLPLSTYVLRQTAQSLIRSSYALVGCVAILAWSGVAVTPAWLAALPGILLIVVTGPAAVLVFAMCGTFFPDMQFVIGNVMRLMLFVTPVIWADGGGSDLRALLYHYNPVTHFLDIVRVPVLDGVVPVQSFVFAALTALALWLLAILLLGRFRRRIVFLL